MNKDSNIPTIKDIPYIFMTFFMILIPWIYFRAKDADQAWYIIRKIVTDFSLFDIDMFYPKRLIVIAALVIFEWFQQKYEHPLHIDFLPTWLRYLVYYVLIILIFIFGIFDYTPFIYFKF